VAQAKEHEESLEKSPKVEKGSVEQSVAKKLELGRNHKDDLRGEVVCRTIITSIMGLSK
jgi:hypothetical protein